MSASNALHSLKAFTAAMLAFGIALSFGLEHPYWAISTVYVVSNPLSGTSASKAVYRLLGTLIGGAMTVFMIPPLASSPELLSIALTGWVSLCAYVSQLDRTPRGYVFQLAGYTALLAGLPVVDSPAAVFDIAVSRVEEIGLAIICAAVINRIVFPSHVGPVLAKQMDAWMDNVKKLAGDVMRRQADVEKTRREWQALTGGIVSMRTLVAEVAYDASHHRELASLLRGLQDRMRLLPPILSAIEDHVSQIRRNPTAANAALAGVLDRVGDWVSQGRGACDEDAAALRAEAGALEDRALAAADADLLPASLMQRVGRFVEVWRECSTLHADLRRESVSPRSERLLEKSTPVLVYRDHGLGLEAAFATMLAVAAPLAFWIASGWPLGMLVTQISGVFCCRWIGMDNPAYVMRKALAALVITAIVSLALNFTVFTTVADYASLTAVLGLFMIPAGAMRATPSQRIMGVLFCIFLPIMANLQGRVSVDFERMATADIGLILGLACCLVVTTLVKAAGAEARARSLLRAGWKVVAEAAANPGLDHSRKLKRLLDLVSLWASRQKAIPPDSGLKKHDLLRDLRLGNNLGRLQDLAAKSSADVRTAIAGLCGDVARFYRKGQRARDKKAVLERLATCRETIAREGGGPQNRRMLALLLSIELCLDPDASAPAKDGSSTRPLLEKAHA